MPQFFIEQECDVGRDVELTGSNAHHISNVLRLEKDDWIILSDGKGRSFRSTIIESNTNRVLAHIDEEVSAKFIHTAPILALSVIKRDRFEWAIQKAVELGCNHIMPMSSKRTVSHRANVDSKKLERWRQIALEAAKQSGLPFRPKIDPPIGFDVICERAANYHPVAMFYEGEERTSIKDFWNAYRSTERDVPPLIIIGPEGGFTDKEVGKARDVGITTISLGRQILRVETAAITTLAIWQYELGNMGACS